MPFENIYLTTQELAHRTHRAIAAIENEVAHLGAQLGQEAGVNRERNQLHAGTMWLGASTVLTTVFTLGVGRALANLDTWFPHGSRDEYVLRHELIRQSISMLSTTAGGLLGNLIATAALEPLREAIRTPRLQPVNPVGLTPDRFYPDLGRWNRRVETQQEISEVQRYVLKFGQRHNKAPLSFYIPPVLMGVAFCIEKNIYRHTGLPAPVYLATTTGVAALGGLARAILISRRARDTTVLVPSDLNFPYTHYAEAPLFHASSAAYPNARGRPFFSETLSETSYSICLRIGALLALAAFVQTGVALFNVITSITPGTAGTIIFNIFASMVAFFAMVAGASIYFELMGLVQFRELERLIRRVLPEQLAAQP